MPSRRRIRVRWTKTIAVLLSAAVAATYLSQTSSPAQAMPAASSAPTATATATADATLTPRADVPFDLDTSGGTGAWNHAGPDIKLLNGAHIADLGFYPSAYGGKSAQLDGVDDYLSSPLGLDAAGSFSVSAWVQPARTDHAQVVLSQSGSSAPAFVVKIDAAGKWTFAMSQSDTANPVWDTATGPAAKAAFHSNVAAVYDAGTKEMRLYVNGSKVATARHSTAWTPSGEFEAGRGRAAGTPAEHLAGYVDELHAWTGVVTDATISELTVPASEARADRCDIGHWLHAGGEQVKATAAAALAGTDWDRRATYQHLGIGGNKLDDASNADRDAYLAAFRALSPQHDSWETVIDPYKYWGDEFIEFWSAPDYGDDVIRFLMDRNDQTFHDYLNPPPPAKPAPAELDRALAIAADMRSRSVPGAPEDWQIRTWSAHQIGRLLRFGGYPTAAPAPGSPEFRMEVESVKIGWADCNPADPDGTQATAYWVIPSPGPLAEVTNTARAEWNAELAAQASPRNAIVAAEVQTMKDLRKASDAMIETQGQAWIVGQLLKWKKYWLSQPKTAMDYPTAAQFTKATADMTAGINKINAQLTLAKAAATSTATQVGNVVTAQSQAATIANTNQTPLYRGLAYAQQSAQVAKASSAATQSASKAIEATLNAARATNADGKALEALAATQRAAQQAEFRRVAAQEAAAQAKAAADAADAQATQAAQMAARAKADRVTAEAAEARARTAAANAHAKRLVAEQERGTAATARARAESERAKAQAAEATAQQQQAIASSAKASALSSGSTAAAKDHEAFLAAQRATDARNAAVAAEQRRDSLTARAQATEAAAQAAAGTSDAQAARAAANDAKAAAASATTAAGNARAAANDASAAAVAARQAATEADGAAERSRAAADGSQAQADTAHAAATTAHAAAADAIDAAHTAAENVRVAEQEANKALAASATAKAEAAEARNQADIAQQQSAVTAGHAYAAGQSAVASRDSALGAVNAALEAISMGGAYKDSDAAAGLAVLVGQSSKSLAEQQAAVAQARADEAAKAAVAAKVAADQASADAKVAAQAAAAAAADASRALAAVKRARASAADAATDAAAAQRAAANAAEWDRQAATDAAAADRAADAAEADAAAADAAATAAERDAASARAAANTAEADAATARAAAAQADRDATEAERFAANARAMAADAENAATRAEADDRAADQQQRASSLSGGSDSPGGGGAALTPEEIEILRAECGQTCVEEYQKALADASKTIMQFIKENGVEILLDVIGYTDLKNCITTGDVEACLWTLVNVASLVIAVGKLPAVSKAVIRVGEGITKFLEASAAGRRTLDRLRAIIERVKKFPRPHCPVTALAARGATAMATDAVFVKARTGPVFAMANAGTVFAVADGDPPAAPDPGPAIKPTTGDADLQHLIDELYKGINRADRVGDGTAMAAASKQFHDGELLRGSDHLKSTAQMRSALKNWLDAHPGVSDDRELAKALIRAINDAQAGNYPDFTRYPRLGGCR
jgi:hypothetical protein